MNQNHSSIIGFVNRFGTEEACREYLEQIFWKGKPVCSHCKCCSVYKYKSRPVYKCMQCKRQFRVTTGTVFEGSNLPLKKWFLAFYLLTSCKKGVSSIQLGKYLNITQKSAWYVAQKIRIILQNRRMFKRLSGIIEVDETYVGGKKKGGKRGRGAADHKTPVFGMLERDGTLRIMPVERVNAKTLKGHIFKNVVKGSTIMSDEFRSYNGLDKFYIHKVVNHGIKEYVNGEIHVNSLEGFWSILKRGIRGIYHRPSRKYMDNYCGEFEFRYNTRKKCIEMQFKRALCQSKKRVKNTDVTNDG